MAVKVGQKAPDFRLQADDGTELSLAELKGKPVVLYFYPKDATPGCTTEACDFRDRAKALSKKGAIVVGVSRDSTESHRRFKEKYGLNFRLLSDPSAKVLKAYGAWGEKVLYGKRSEGTLRSTVIIGPDGTIQKTWPKVKVQGHADEVLESL